jgi:CRISPR system Cascade subunit CasA
LYISDKLLNLIEDPWIPCRSKEGKIERLAPWQVFEPERELKISQVATTRPDFQGTIIQFLIGLVQTTIPPHDEHEWIELLGDPPDPRYVKERFTSVSNAFNLAGDGPRFMQDPSCADGKEQPIESLVIGMPGKNTLELNRDFFSKRGNIHHLCPTCAAMALMTLQVNGPPGGRGYMTGLRGGGPLTTVIMGNSLAETVWLNVLPENEFYVGLKGDAKSEIHDVFPWMGPLRTSEGANRSRRTSIMDVSQLQMFWGMGRRILLETGETEKSVCDICGEETRTGICRYRTKRYGIQYDESWRHVLTPYYKKGDTMLPVHLSPEGITYRHWLGIVQNDMGEGREAARVVQWFHRMMELVWEMLPKTPRLWAFGYDFDKVKARCWYDSTMPLVFVREDIKEDYELCTAQIVRAAQFTSDAVHRAVINALYSSESKKKTVVPPTSSQKTPKNFPIVRARFWAETESLFYETLEKLKFALESRSPVEPVKVAWVREARRIGLSLFDFYAQVKYIDEYRPKDVVKARKRLAMTIAPGAPKIAKLLGLPREVKT